MTPEQIDTPRLNERFWSKVSVTSHDQCWLWNGAEDGHGYGTLTHKQRNYKAPRVAFFLRNGKWPRNACHRCDNPRCCNPDHIFDGSSQDNARDMEAKGRSNHPKGEVHYRASFTADDIKYIRESSSAGASRKDLAKAFRCTPNGIKNVVERKTWKHIH